MTKWGRLHLHLLQRLDTLECRVRNYWDGGVEVCGHQIALTTAQRGRQMETDACKTSTIATEHMSKFRDGADPNDSSVTLVRVCACVPRDRHLSYTNTRLTSF